jgi:hypothetical protein
MAESLLSADGPSRGANAPPLGAAQRRQPPAWGTASSHMFV